MQFYELIQAVHDLELGRFTERYRNPFLLEEDPQERRSTRLLSREHVEVEPSSERRVFEVVRRDGRDGPILIGRSATADVRIEEKTVSSRHATLKRTPGIWLVTDLSSVNGTQVGDRPIPPGMDAPLTPGSTLKLGPDVRLAFFEPARVHHVLKQLAPRILRALSANQAVQQGTIHLSLPRGTSGDAETRPPPSTEATSSEIWLVLRCDPFPPVPLAPGRDVFVGRTAANDVCLPHTAVSRRHASLKRQGDAVLVRDLGSANGTFVGERRVRGEAFLEPGGPPVVVGPFELKVQAVAKGRAPEGFDGTALMKREGLRGNLQSMPLADFLQAVEMNARSGVITVDAPDGGRGEIVFANGAPVSAHCGDARGEDAVFRLLRLKAGDFCYLPDPGVAERPREIQGTFLKILIEASRREDEGGRTGHGSGEGILA